MYDMNIPHVSLAGRFVVLQPMTAAHRNALKTTLASDVGAWDAMATNGGPGGFGAWWESRCGSSRRGESLPYVVCRHADGEVLGTTGFYNVKNADCSVEIGSTFYRPDVRGGPVNPECKFLLLEHAFRNGAVRVEFATDAINTRSRAALAKLGAVAEGTLRRHKLTWTGRVRDTVMFSVLDSEWPDVRAGLKDRLAEYP